MTGLNNRLAFIFVKKIILLNRKWTSEEVKPFSILELGGKVG